MARTDLERLLAQPKGDAPRTRCRYYFKRMEHTSLGDVVWIEDLNMGVSITNDAEAVCRRLHWLVPNARIFYKDTEGNWDELVHTAGKFERFAPARAQAAREKWT